MHKRTNHFFFHKFFLSMDLYFKIKEQRKTFRAPVDNMGCYSVGVGHEGNTKKFQILIALLLSSQTRDEVTYSAIKSLNSFLGTLTPEHVLKSPEDSLHKCIEKVGYHNKKVKFLIEISKRVRNAMPNTLEDVLKLPGIGKKMAYLYLQHGCGRNEGIGVDTHVHRISNRIGLVQTREPEETRKALEKMLETSEWQEINRVMVGFGQTVCTPTRPKCSQCIVSEECPCSTVPGDEPG